MNALAWTGIEIGYRIEPRLSVLADYFVSTGYYFAYHGVTAGVALAQELASWASERAQMQHSFVLRAYFDGQVVGEFWLDRDADAHARRSMPMRPVHSIERIYDDVLFDIA